MSRLRDKVAIITGAARGMGAATSRLFWREDATVIIADLPDSPGEALARELGGAAQFHPLNVAREAQWEKLVANVMQQHGRIDALVNNAGVLHFSDIDHLLEADLDRVLSVNVKGPLFGIKHVGRVMKAARRGAIVNISSIDGMRGANALAAYSSSKWAIRGLTRSAALEYGPHGVRVNSVHPGGIDTGMGNPQGLQGEQRNAGYERVPLQRIGEPNEVAAASLFLCSDEASYISGAEILVDGGWAAGWYHTGLPASPPSLSGNG
jgi:3alpha(or 20beta)-hydroxysteroid dehydrogenase